MTGQENIAPKCPKCGSTEVSKPAWSRRAMALGLLLLGFPFFFWWKERHCFDCATDFRDRPSA